MLTIYQMIPAAATLDAKRVEFYEFESDLFGRMIFDVQRARRIAERSDPIPVDLPSMGEQMQAAWARFIGRTEASTVWLLMQGQPPVSGTLPNGDVILLDGNKRAYGAYLAGVDVLPILMLDKEQTKAVMLDPAYHEDFDEMRRRGWIKTPPARMEAP